MVMENKKVHIITTPILVGYRKSLSKGLHIGQRPNNSAL